MFYGVCVRYQYISEVIFLLHFINLITTANLQRIMLHHLKVLKIGFNKNRHKFERKRSCQPLCTNLTNFLAFSILKFSVGNIKKRLDLLQEVTVLCI